MIYRTFKSEEELKIKRLYNTFEKKSMFTTFSKKGKATSDIKELKEDYFEDSLDVKVLYFLYLFNKGNHNSNTILSLLSNPNDIGFITLKEINVAVNENIDFRFNRIKSNKEILTIIQNGFYNYLEEEFTLLFSEVKPPHIYWAVDNLRDKNHMKNLGKIITAFKKNFSVEPNYKNKILEILLKIIERKQKEFDNRELVFFDFGEKLLNKCINKYMQPLFEEAFYDMEIPYIKFKFKKSPTWYLSRNNRWFVLGLISFPLGFLFATIFSSSLSLFLLFSTICLAGGVFVVLPTFVNFEECWGFKYSKDNDSQLETEKVPIPEDNTLFKNKLEQAISVFSDYEDLVEQLVVYHNYFCNKDKMHISYLVVRLNVYLETFLDYILEKGTNTTKEHISEVYDAFYKANRTLEEKVEKTEAKDDEYQRVGLNIAKRELDLIIKENSL